MSRTIFYPQLFFSTVNGALAPLSANTQYTLCAHDCDGNEVIIVPPAPVYLNEKGKAVEQLNMVVLGGVNGLNA